MADPTVAFEMVHLLIGGGTAGGGVAAGMIVQQWLARKNGILSLTRDMAGLSSSVKALANRTERVENRLDGLVRAP